MRPPRRPWNPCALVFLTSACIMVIELVASRLIAPRVGVSLYTWTSVIGVTLAGISLGNYVGGKLADRRGSPELLGFILALASLSSLSVLWLNNDLHEISPPFAVPFMAVVLTYIAGVFFLPSAILGCVSPIVVRLTVNDLRRTGTTVGRIYAWSSVGSIVGTLATGFLLISWLGTKTTIVLVSAMLTVLAAWFLTDAPWRAGLLRGGMAVCLFGISIWSLRRGGYLRPECRRETNYYCINVNETEIKGRQIRELLLDRLVHSYSDLNDPAHLVYGYERTYAEVIGPLVERKPDLDVLFIGGGGYTFPRYLEATLPESHLVVAEIDPGVTEAAHAWLGLSLDTRIETRILDARNFLAWQSEPDSYDLVVGDAFNDYSVPFHLTTLEFDHLVDRLLRQDGLYVVNIVDGGPRGHFLRAYVHTLRRVFRHVAVIPSSAEWKKSFRTTFVIVASQDSLQLAEASSEYSPLGEAELEEYLSVEPPLILTDDYVPVDNLMAPVVGDSFFPLEVDSTVVSRITLRVAVVAVAALMVVAWFVVRHVRRRRARGAPS